jgi:hypothetical protein
LSTCGTRPPQGGQEGGEGGCVAHAPRRQQPAPVPAWRLRSRPAHMHAVRTSPETETATPAAPGDMCTHTSSAAAGQHACEGTACMQAARKMEDSLEEGKSSACMHAGTHMDAAGRGRHQRSGRLDHLSRHPRARGRNRRAPALIFFIAHPCLRCAPLALASASRGCARGPRVAVRRLGRLGRRAYTGARLAAAALCGRRLRAARPLQQSTFNHHALQVMTRPKRRRQHTWRVS